MKNSKFILFLIILIAIVLRLGFIGDYPNGLSNDESAIGYNAYSILKTGKDEYGVQLPLAFKSFGEYKAPLYIYSTIPYIAVFGISEFSIRLPSLIFSIGTIIFLYLLVNRLSGKKSLALASAFILTIIPWHIQFSRIAYEGNSTLFLLTSGLYFFVKGLKSTKLFILSFIFFGLTMYSHFSVRLFIPLFVMYILLNFRQEILVSKKKLFLGLLAGFITLVPLMPYLFSNAGLGRAQNISFITDKGLISKINEERQQFTFGNNGVIPADIIYNKPVEFTKQFIVNYLSHFNPTFLFIEGDGDTLFNTPNTGPLLFVFVPFLVFGIFAINKFNPLNWVTWGWLFLSVIPSSLTRLSGSTNRAFIMLIPICIIIGTGLNFLINFFKEKKLYFVLLTYILLVVLEYFTYLNNYYFILPVRREYDQRVASKITLDYLNKHLKDYNWVWVNDNPQAYIQYLLYLKYNPQDYQKEANLSAPDEFGFGKVNHFGKFIFDPDSRVNSDKVIYLSRTVGEPGGFKLKNKLYRIDGTESYYIYEN